MHLPNGGSFEDGIAAVETMEEGRGQRSAQDRRLKPTVFFNPSREGVLESRGEKITSRYSVERRVGLRETRLMRGRKVRSYPSLTSNKDPSEDEFGHRWTRTE